MVFQEQISMIHDLLIHSSPWLSFSLSVRLSGVAEYQQAEYLCPRKAAALPWLVTGLHMSPPPSVHPCALLQHSSTILCHVVFSYVCLPVFFLHLKCYTSGFSLCGPC